MKLSKSGRELELSSLLMSLVLEGLGVAIEVGFGVKVVLTSHWVVEPKVLHSHCLQKISQQCFESSKQNPYFDFNPPQLSSSATWLAAKWPQFWSRREKNICKKVASTYPASEAGERRDYWL